MSTIDIGKFSRQSKPQKPNANRHPPGTGSRVREAQGDAQSTDAFLNHLREVVTGPSQRVSEARFEEMLDILMEQDDFARSKFYSIESDLEDVVSETGFLRQKYDALHDRVEIVVARSEAERQATQEAFDDALGKLRAEFESKAAILAETLQKSLKETELETRRALTGLSTTVQSNRVESTRLFEQAQASSLNSLEKRIAQWRAEIEDERKEDMGEVAAALMEIGKRMLTQRHAMT